MTGFSPICPRAHTISIGVSYIMCRKAEVSAVSARPSLTKGDAQMLNPSSNPERSPQKKGPHQRWEPFLLEATPRFELGNQGFADPCLTTWLCRHGIEKGAVSGRPFHLERLTRLELATSTLARWRSTR